MSEDFKSLKKEVQRLKFRNGIKDVLLTVSLVVLVVLFVIQKKETKLDKIIRVQGIIVEDQNGKERILIGAPIPYAHNRARTDTLKIKETWGKRFGKEYMNWYKNYAHHANGIVILDENGWDKVILGDPAPDPIIGKRIGSSTGIIINDSKGLERTGYGILEVDGEDRVVLGLDNNTGGEGITLTIMPDGTTGILVNTENQSIFMGSATSGNWNSPDGKDFHGILIKDSIQKVISTKENL